VLVTGPNGAGKTNLVEAIHLAAQGFSFRTRADGQLVRSGSDEGTVRIDGAAGGAPLSTEVRVSVREPKRISLNGASVASAEDLRRRVHVLVFTPDRLAVVKGGPAARRAYLDRSVGRLLPARADASPSYGLALGQRNACLRRVAAGLSSRDALEPWTTAVAEAGATLTEARSAALALLAGPFAERAGELGLNDGRLELVGAPATSAALEARVERDLERGSTGLGPHLDELRILAGERDLRAFGSQGEQRLAVLALVLAEAELLAAHEGIPPLLLLDDALSELDAARRRILSARVGVVGQAIVTATGAEALPAAPAQLLEVSSGTVRVA
jgi:DNA replication and repair protein RecF